MVEFFCFYLGDKFSGARRPSSDWHPPRFFASSSSKENLALSSIPLMTL